MLKIQQHSKLMNSNEESWYIFPRKVNIIVTIRSLTTADVVITQVFRNDEMALKDIVFCFPIKNQVTPYTLTANIDDQTIIHQFSSDTINVLSKQDDKLRNDDIFNIGILPLSKNCTINIAYTTQLNCINRSTIQLIIPSAILPRLNSNSKHSSFNSYTVQFECYIELIKEFGQQRITHTTSSSHRIQFNFLQQNIYLIIYKQEEISFNDNILLNIELDNNILPPNIITTNRIGQPFDYYCVLDFEAVCHQANPNSKKKSPDDIWEIIEFPICLLEAQTNTIVDIYHSYVRPTIKSTLNNICINITGITQDMVDQSPSFEIVWKEVQQFLSKHSLISSDINKSNLHSFTWITCGNWDLRTMLPLQLKQSGFDRPKFINNFINLKDLYMEYYPSTQIRGMKDMLKQSNLTLQGKHHSGIDDTKNIARVAQWLIQNKKILKLTTNNID